MVVLIAYAFVFLNHTHSLKMFWERKFEIFIMVPVSKNLVKDKKRRKEENQKNPRLQFTGFKIGMLHLSISFL